MKKTKKLLALFLALMMALSCMVMPAMAHGHEDDGIMPLYEINPCPRCGKNAEYHPDKVTGEIWVVCLNALCNYTGPLY